MYKRDDGISFRNEHIFPFILSNTHRQKKFNGKNICTLYCWVKKNLKKTTNGEFVTLIHNKINIHDIIEVMENNVQKINSKISKNSNYVLVYF